MVATVPNIMQSTNTDQLRVYLLILKVSIKMENLVMFKR
jgi:hypothetical protein